MDTKDPFKDISVDGHPGNYRKFRRKVILSVAALEDKVQHLAGPKFLSRLTGEAWRCTEHLSIADLRCQRGWLKVLEFLGRNCKHFPEVELHESIDEFLLHLKRKPHEGATAFASRFKTSLARLENMIAAEREASHAKRRRKDDRGRRFLSPASPVASSLENSSDDHGAPDKPDGPADETDGEVSEGSRKPAHADTAKSSAEAKTAADAKDETFASPAHKSGPPSQPPGGPPSHSSRSSKSGRKHSTASYKAEQECAQLEMQCILGTLEPGFRKQKPIFPQSVLGHLFLRKFGLNREQRSQVIRSTGGSSRFLREEAHMTEPTVNTQFQYMVSSINVAHAEDEVFLASIPVGMAILDTGCIQHHSCGVRDCPSIY